MYLEKLFTVYKATTINIFILIKWLYDVKEVSCSDGWAVSLSFGVF